MKEIFRAALELIEKGQRGALATIIATRGSTPGEETGKLLVRDDGSAIGTVGGGCTEADVWSLAMEVIATDRPRRARFRLTAATAGETGLLCGGEFEVFIEPIGHPQVFIFGAGHVAQSLVPLLLTLEYGVTVVDDRESFACRERFMEPTRLEVRDFETAFDGLEIGSGAYVIIVTRGHEHDEMVLGQAVRSGARYIGLIGSRGKIGAIRKNLRKKGVAPELLERVRAPIGVSIGSQSPAEVAISIAAELVGVRRGVIDPAPGPEPRLPETQSGERASTRPD